VENVAVVLLFFGYLKKESPIWQWEIAFLYYHKKKLIEHQREEIMKKRTSAHDFSGGTGFNAKKWVDNPDQKILEQIPSIEQRYGVVIEKFWSETYNNSAIIIYGDDACVDSACEEIMKIQENLPS